MTLTRVPGPWLAARTLDEVISFAQRLDERLAFTCIPGDELDADGNSSIERHLRRWQQVLACDDPVQVERTLEWHEISSCAWREAFRDRNPPVPTAGAWQTTLRLCIEADGALACGEDAITSMSLQDRLNRLVSVGSTLLNARTLAYRDLFAPDARAILEGELERWLHHCCLSSIDYVDRVTCAARRSGIPALITDLGTLRPSEDAQISGLLRYLFYEFPVLARLVAQTIDQWVDYVAELAERLALDMCLLRDAFPDVSGQVTRVTPSLSDRHHGGKTVCVLEFSGSGKIVYKPRDIGIEASFQRVLNTLNRWGIPQQQRVIRIFNRHAYGWAEYVEAAPCPGNDQGLLSFRCGELLCLAYLMGATDLHSENVVFTGAFPVLVDLETLFHPEAETETTSAEDQERALASSVLRTGLLPKQQATIEGGVRDTSAFGVLEAELQVRGAAGEAWAPTDAIASLRKGFEAMYRFVAHRREPLIHLFSERMAKGEARFIFRPTAVYALVRDAAFQCQFLRRGVDRSLEFRVLERALLPSDEKPEFWPLLRMEAEALEDLDIPRFVIRADDAFLRDDRGAVIMDFGRSAIARMADRVRNLSDADWRLQDSIIRTCFHTVALENAAARTCSDHVSAGVQASGLRHFHQKALLLAETVENTAVRAGDGSIYWLDPARDASTTGYDIFEGSAGTALFLAAVARLTGRRKYRELARRAVQPLLRLNPEKASEGGVVISGIGGLIGKGSVIYALTRMGEWLDDREFTATALRIADSLSFDEIDSDVHYDLTRGTAGAALGLLVLHAVTGRADLLSKAEACGLRLLHGRRPSPQGFRVWATIGDRCQTGLSHGASGIAYALLRLNAATGDSLFRTAAAEGLAWERTLRQFHHGEWPDLRSQDSLAYPACSWCNGAPGIALSRAGALKLCDLEEGEEELRAGLRITQKRPLSNIDQLCCGNWGRVECLFEAGRLLGDKRMVDEALGLAGQLSYGDIRLSRCNPQGLYSSGFYQGVAGIGYQMLRLADPESVPSVLLWS